MMNSSVFCQRKLLSSMSCDSAVMVITQDDKLAIQRTGDEKWTNVDDGHEKSSYDDVAFHQEKFMLSAPQD